jgi:hypothetical protein
MGSGVKMAPILTEILNAITAKIDGMNDTEYNLNWGQTNEHDTAKLNFERIDAQAQIMPNEETNSDFDEGAHANAYRNRLDLQLLVRVPAIVESDNANYDILTRMFLALDDLKKCFAGFDVYGHYMQYDRWEIIYDENGDVFFPRRMNVYYHIEYNQDRTNPETIGDV